MTIPDTLEQLKGWKAPREAFHSGQKIPFLLACYLSDHPASETEIAQVEGGPDLKTFWRLVSEAELFRDDSYGQWGLKILPPLEVVQTSEQERQERPDDMCESDLVIGEFIGDSDQLLIDTSRSEKGEYPVLVKLPIDAREEWSVVAGSFAEFLSRYVSAQGQKYWE